jgi:diguanylate cyclase (GGDEF)-like protein
MAGAVELYGLQDRLVSDFFCASEISMNQSNCSQRDWRVDLSNATASGAPQEADEKASGSPRSPGCLAPRRSRLSWWTMQTATRFLAAFAPGVRVGRAELILHTMARTLDRCDRPEQVTNALIESIGQLTGSSEIEWVHEASKGGAISNQIDQHTMKYSDLVVRAGCKSKGYIRVFSTPGRSVAWSEATLLRLGTLCAQAAGAIDRLELQNSMDGDKGPNQNPGCPFPDEPHHELGAELTGSGHRAVPSVQDATFLNAVLPFVMSQARRYGEPLSLISVAVDRLNGIRELLGLDQADRAVREVGLRIAGVIRSSDVVARIDDDRIIAVLPRASLQDAWRIADNVCHAIEQCHPLSPELPSLTVSVGVAEYPSCASSAYGLLDAADHALSLAQAQGRNRAIAASLLTEPVSNSLAKCAG